MKKRVFKFFVSVVLPAIMLFAGICCAVSSFSFSNAFAISGNGGIVLVSNNSTFNMTSGTISGGSATNGGGVYVRSEERRVGKEC